MGWLSSNRRGRERFAIHKITLRDYKKFTRRCLDFDDIAYGETPRQRGEAMLIEWNENLSVDGGVIDADHRHLIAIANEFADSAAKEIDQRCLGQILVKLKKYTKDHFAREESLQLSIDYPDADAHRKAHAELIEQLDDTLRHFLDDRGKGQYDVSSQELGNLLRHWLIDHMADVDHRLRPYAMAIRTFSGGFPPLESGDVTNNSAFGNQVPSRLIEWNDTISVDKGIVDEDHRHLIRIVNEFAFSIGRGAREKELGQILLDLRAYAAAHFSREEKLQLQIGFPFARAHQKAHEELIRSLSATLRHFVEDRETGRLNDSVTDIGNLLRRWLMDHILDADMRMKPYAAEMQGFRQNYAPLTRINVHGLFQGQATSQRGKHA